MAKGEDFSTGYTDLSYQEQRDTAAEILSDNLEENQPEAMRELNDHWQQKRPPIEASWLQQSHADTIDNPEELTQYHQGLNHDTTAGKIFGEFQEVGNMGWDTREMKQLAGRIAEMLLCPVKSAAALAGLQPANSNLPGRTPVRHLDEILRDSMTDLLHSTSQTLYQGYREGFAVDMDAMKPMMDDIATWKGAGRPATFHELASSRIQDDWRKITLAENSGKMYETATALRGSGWSREYQYEVAKDLGDAMVVEARTQVRDYKTEHPAPTEFQRNIMRLFTEQLDQAASNITESLRLPDRDDYRKAVSEATDTVKQVNDFVTDGLTPWVKDEG